MSQKTNVPEEFLEAMLNAINADGGGPEMLLNLTVEDGEHLGHLCYAREKNKSFMNFIGEVTLPAIGPASLSLMDAAELFDAFHDKKDFQTQKDTAGPELQISMYEMKNEHDGTGRFVFESLNRPIEELVVPGSRIVQLVKDFANYLHRRAHYNLFLTQREADKKIFIIKVIRDEDGLKVIRYALDHNFIYQGKLRNRIFVPKKVAPTKTED